MDIKKIAKRLVHGYWKRDQWNIEYFDSVGFAEALISAYKDELLKEVTSNDVLGEPVAWTPKKFFIRTFTTTPPYTDLLSEYDALYTSDQLAAAIAKAERRVAEWISVCDKLPDIETPVLVARKGRRYAERTCYTGKEWLLESNHNPVTHWMPLPKAPNGASS